MDKKTKRIIRMLLVISVLAILSICPVFADSNEILPTDLASPAEGDVFVGLQGVFYGDEQAALDRINEIRMEACREGVENPSKKGTSLTMADYVQIKWSKGLEQGARWRAAESSLTRAHLRSNGDDWFKVQYPSGATSYGEILAWNNGDNSINGIEQFYREKSDWVNQTPGAVTGHYTQMIDPSNKYVGIATFHGGVGAYATTTAGEFSDTSSELDQTMLGTKEGIQLISVKKSDVTEDFYLDNDYSNKVFNVGDEVDYKMLTNATVNNRSYQGLIVYDATWSVSDSSILRCSNGHVAFKTCGEATVTATAGSFGSGSSAPTATNTIKREHSWSTITDKNPTCTETGQTHEECSKCGDIQNTKVLPALGHKWETITDRESTCTKQGEAHDECTVCHATGNVTNLPLKEHTWKTVRIEPTCIEDGETHEECSSCHITRNSEELPAIGHTWGAWKTTKAATVFVTGNKSRTCSICGYAENMSIKKLTPTIKLSATKKTIKKGKTAYITVSKLAKGDSIKSVTVRSKSIATVKKVKTGKYKITAKKKGATTVTVILKSGKKAICKVTVKK